MMSKLYPEEDKENSVDFSSNVVHTGNKSKDEDGGWRDIANTQPPNNDNSDQLRGFDDRNGSDPFGEDMSQNNIL